MIIVNNGTLLKAKSPSSRSKFYIFHGTQNSDLSQWSQVWVSGWNVQFDYKELEEVWVSGGRDCQGPQGRHSRGALGSQIRIKEDQKCGSCQCAKGSHILEKAHMKKAGKSFRCQVLDFTMKKWHVAGFWRTTDRYLYSASQLDTCKLHSVGRLHVRRTSAQSDYSITGCADLRDRKTPPTASQVQRTVPDRNLPSLPLPVLQTARLSSISRLCPECATQLTGFPSTDCNPIPNLPPGYHTHVTCIETVYVPKLFSHTVIDHFLVCSHKYLIHDWLNPQKVSISNSWTGMKTL